MKKYFWGNLAIAASLSLANISCTPSNQTTSTTPSATATVASTPSPSTTSSATTSPTAKPSESPSPTASATTSPTAKPSESPDSTSATTKPEKAPDVVRIAVINNSGKVLKAIYMSAPKKEDWGDNELDIPLNDREKADFEWKRSSYKGDDAGCIFDIKAEYTDGKIAELDPIDVCKTPAINLK